MVRDLSEESSEESFLGGQASDTSGLITSGSSGPPNYQSLDLPPTYREATRTDWQVLRSEFPMGRFTRAGKGPYPDLSRWNDDEGHLVNWPFEVSAEMQMFLTRFILGPIDIIFKGLSGATPEGEASRKFEWSKNLLLLEMSKIETSIKLLTTAVPKGPSSTTYLRYGAIKDGLLFLKNNATFIELLKAFPPDSDVIKKIELDVVNLEERIWALSERQGNLKTIRANGLMGVDFFNIERNEEVFVRILEILEELQKLIAGAKLRIQQCSWIIRSAFGLTNEAQAENLGLVLHSGAGAQQLAFFLRDVSGRRGCFLAKVVKKSDTSTITFFSMGEKVFQLAYSMGLKEFLWIRVDISTARDWWHELPGLGSHSNWETAGLAEFLVIEILGDSPGISPTTWGELEGLFDSPEKDFGKGTVEALFNFDLQENRTVRRIVRSKKKKDGKKKASAADSSVEGKKLEKPKRGKFSYRPRVDSTMSRDHYNEVVDGWFALFNSPSSSSSSGASIPGPSLVRKRLRKDGALISDSTVSSDVFGEDNWGKKLAEMRKECQNEDLWLESLATRLVPPPPPLDDTVVEPRQPIRLEGADDMERDRARVVRISLDYLGQLVASNRDLPIEYEEPEMQFYWQNHILQRWRDVNQSTLGLPQPDLVFNRVELGLWRGHICALTVNHQVSLIWSHAQAAMVPVMWDDQADAMIPLALPKLIDMEADLGPDAPENVIKDLIATVANDLKDDFSLENSASISATGVSLDGCKRKKIVRDAFSSATPSEAENTCLESLLISQNLSENPEGWENINFIPVPNFDESNTFADDMFWISKSEKPAGYGHICADPTNLKVIQILKVMRRQMIPVRIQVEAREKSRNTLVKFHLAFLCQKGVRMPKILKVVAWILALRKDFDVRAMVAVTTEGVNTVVGGARWERGDTMTVLKDENEFLATRMQRFNKWVSGISENKKFKLAVDLVNNNDLGILSKFTSEFSHEKDQSWQQKQRIVIVCWNSLELVKLDSSHPEKDNPIFLPYQRPLVPTRENTKNDISGLIFDVDPNLEIDRSKSQLFGFEWEKVRHKISIFLQRGSDLGRLLYCVKHIFKTNYPKDWMEQMHYLVDLQNSPLIQNEVAAEPFTKIIAQKCSPSVYAEALWSLCQRNAELAQSLKVFEVQPVETSKEGQLRTFVQIELVERIMKDDKFRRKALKGAKLWSDLDLANNLPDLQDPEFPDIADNFWAKFAKKFGPPHKRWKEVLLKWWMPNQKFQWIQMSIHTAFHRRMYLELFDAIKKALFIPARAIKDHAWILLSPIMSSYLAKGAKEIMATEKFTLQVRDYHPKGRCAKLWKIQKMFVPDKLIICCGSQSTSIFQIPLGQNYSLWKFLREKLDELNIVESIKNVEDVFSFQWRKTPRHAFKISQDIIILSWNITWQEEKLSAKRDLIIENWDLWKSKDHILRNFSEYFFLNFDTLWLRDEFHLKEDVLMKELITFEQAADGRLVSNLENSHWIYSENCLTSFLEKQSLGEDMYSDLQEVQERKLCMLTQCMDEAKFIMGTALCPQHYSLLTAVTPVTDKMSERVPIVVCGQKFEFVKTHKEPVGILEWNQFGFRIESRRQHLDNDTDLMRLFIIIWALDNKLDVPNDVVNLMNRNPLLKKKAIMLKAFRRPSGIYRNWDEVFDNLRIKLRYTRGNLVRNMILFGVDSIFTMNLRQGAVPMLTNEECVKIPTRKNRPLKVGDIPREKWQDDLPVHWFLRSDSVELESPICSITDGFPLNWAKTKTVRDGKIHFNIQVLMGYRVFPGFNHAKGCQILHSCLDQAPNRAAICLGAAKVSGDKSTEVSLEEVQDSENFANLRGVFGETKLSEIMATLLNILNIRLYRPDNRLKKFDREMENLSFCDWPSMMILWLIEKFHPEGISLSIITQDQYSMAHFLNSTNKGNFDVHGDLLKWSWDQICNPKDLFEKLKFEKGRVRGLIPRHDLPDLKATLMVFAAVREHGKSVVLNMDIGDEPNANFDGEIDVRVWHIAMLLPEGTKEMLHPVQADPIQMQAFVRPAKFKLFNSDFDRKVWRENNEIDTYQWNGIIDLPPSEQTNGLYIDHQGYTTFAAPRLIKGLVAMKGCIDAWGRNYNSAPKINYRDGNYWNAQENRARGVQNSNADRMDQKEPSYFTYGVRKHIPIASKGEAVRLPPTVLEDAAFIRIMFSEISPVCLSSQFMATDAIFDYKDNQKVDFNYRDSIHEFEKFGSFLQTSGRKRTWKNSNMSYYRREGPAAKVISAGAGVSGSQVKKMNPKAFTKQLIPKKPMADREWELKEIPANQKVDLLIVRKEEFMKDFEVQNKLLNCQSREQLYKMMSSIRMDRWLPSQTLKEALNKTKIKMSEVQVRNAVKVVRWTSEFWCWMSTCEYIVVTDTEIRLKPGVIPFTIWKNTLRGEFVLPPWESVKTGRAAEPQGPALTIWLDTKKKFKCRSQAKWVGRDADWLKGKILDSEEPEDFFRALGSLSSKHDWPVPQDVRNAALDLDEDDQVLFAEYYERIEKFLVHFWGALVSEDFCKIKETGEILWTSVDSGDECLKVVRKVLAEIESVKVQAMVRTKEAPIYKNTFK